jgi:uncharacterized glyoxalase superfamily protein PhnB
MTAIQPIPAGYHTITPHLTVYDAAAAIDFYKRAFGAKECARMTSPDGQRVVHAEIRIGDSIVMLCDECREFGQLAPTSLGGTSTSLHLYVTNADEAFERAVLAGATIEMPIQETFWGDRYGKVSDPFGHRWSLSTRVREVSEKELAEGAKACFQQAASC